MEFQLSTSKRSSSLQKKKEKKRKSNGGKERDLNLFFHGREKCRERWRALRLNVGPWQSGERSVQEYVSTRGVKSICAICCLVRLPLKHAANLSGCLIVLTLLFAAKEIQQQRVPLVVYL